jgi:membrane-bound metal-dependent hydrolase YbcI (DUF457 family)
MGPAGHTLAGLTVYFGFCTQSRRSPTVSGLITATVLANSPDFDLVPAIWAGFQTANKLHHSYSHTFAFALAAGLLAAAAPRLLGDMNRWRTASLGFLIVASHVITDFFTRDTGFPFGEMILWPFSSRYILGPTVFLDIYKPSWAGLMDLHNLKATIHEILIFTPVLSWMSFHLYYTYRMKSQGSPG